MINLLKDQLKEYSDKIKILEKKMVEKIKESGNLNFEEDLEILRPELYEISGLRMMQNEVVKMMDNYLKSGAIQ